jgi:uncharacterized membrane protein
MSKNKKVFYYVFLGIVTVLFLFSGASKLMGQAQAVTGFAQIGLPVWFMYVIGAGEVLGAIGLWVSKLQKWAAAGLFEVLVGAFVTTWVAMGFLFSLFPLVVAVILAKALCLKYRHPVPTVTA